MQWHFSLDSQRSQKETETAGTGFEYLSKQEFSKEEQYIRTGIFLTKQQKAFLQNLKEDLGESEIF